jgi:hypothetical protein
MQSKAVDGVMGKLQRLHIKLLPLQRCLITRASKSKEYGVFCCILSGHATEYCSFSSQYMILPFVELTVRNCLVGMATACFDSR